MCLGAAVLKFGLNKLLLKSTLPQFPPLGGHNALLLTDLTRTADT